ncbi:MAG TPA: hypothetical protein VF945_00465, partial [Polyangia bacterium]
MMWTSIALVGLSTIVGATNGVAEQMSAVVQGCAQQDGGACERLSAHLTARFAGASTTDRQVGARLAARAVLMVRRAGVGRACSDGEAGACDALARVLDGLFSGDDVQLDRSADRALAHAVAEHVVVGTDGVAAAPLDEQQALARFRAAAALATSGRFAEAAREYLSSFRAKAWPSSLLAAAESF